MISKPLSISVKQMAFRKSHLDAYYLGTINTYTSLASSLGAYTYPVNTGYVMPLDFSSGTCLSFSSSIYNYGPVGTITSMIQTWGIYTTVPDIKLLISPTPLIVAIPDNPLPIVPKSWCTMGGFTITVNDHALDSSYSLG